jgi:hypothetical protein
MKKVRVAFPLSVVLVMLLVGLLPASAGQPGTGTTTIYVQNADDTDDAQIVAEFFNPDGTSAGTYSIAALPPYIGSAISLGSVSPALPTTWSGSVVVSSDQEIAAVGRTVYSSVPSSGDGVTAGDYLALAAPGLVGYLPFIWNHISRNTVFSIQNTTGSEANVEIHYTRRADGTEIPGSGTCSGSPILDTVPANGVVVYDLLNQTRNGIYSGGVGGKIPCQDQAGTGQPAAGTAGYFDGSVYVSSDVDIAAASSTHWRTYEGVYTGAISDEAFLYYPQVVRHKNPSTGQWIRWSSVIAQNTQSFSVDVTVSLLSPSGNVVFSDTIPALSSREYNTRYISNFPTSVWSSALCTEGDGLDPDCPLEAGLGTPAWTGAATVRVDTPGGRVVGVGHVMYAANHEFSHEAVGPSAGSQVVVCPFMWDRDSTSNLRYGNLIVQNVSSTAPATVDIYIFKQSNATGGLAAADLTIMGEVIGAGEHIEANTRWDTPWISASTFDPLGNEWDGSAVIVSRDEPIVGAMSSFRLPSTPKWSTTYNCYSVP